MADHYRVLGITSNATKSEIKEAFRKLAIKFHPDKHAQSPKPSRDAATLKFKQVSEAYEVLIDDRKRAAYNISRRYNNGGNYQSYGGSNNYSYSNNNYNSNYYYYEGSYHKAGSSSSSRWMSNLDAVLRYMTTRSFLLHVAFASVLLGATVAVDMSGNTLWKMQNSGKSFEDAMESIEKNKARKGKP